METEKDNIICIAVEIHFLQIADNTDENQRSSVFQVRLKKIF
jgi:hypothetical protein